MFGRTRVAIMGTGKIAEVMARTLKNTKGVTCYAVGSRTEEKAKELLPDPETKRVGEFYRIGYEAIAIMKGRIGSSGV